MTNIPTDLLRTLLAVIDLRSFTRAAQSLGEPLADQTRDDVGRAARTIAFKQMDRA